MTAKKAQARVPSSRITDTWHRRPWLTLTTLGTAVAILSAVGPAILAGVHYFTTHGEFVQHQLHDESKDAWNSVQLIRLETVQARNRVNDCDIRREQTKMTDLERSACATYRAEYESAVKSFEAAQSAAMATTKEAKQ